MATATRPARAAPHAPARVRTPRSPNERRESAAAPTTDGRWWGAASLTALLLLGALFPQPLLLDVDAGGALVGAALARPALYTLLAPVTTSLDALSLLSVRQHIAVVVGTVLAYAGWRASRHLRGRTRRGVLGEGALGIVCVATIVAVYAVACLVPRPMVALVVSDPDLVRVDFHAHTRASHDGRRGFDAERAREWHRSGGFDVAYVTDHGTWSGAEAGEQRNPARAGEGMILLSAVEAWSGGEHLNVLGATAADSSFLLPDEQIDDAAIARAVAAGRRAPVLISTVPGFLDTLARGVAGGFPGRALGRVSAIELSDAAPRGFEQSDSTRERVLRMADDLDLAIVAGSDNHGWGRTAAAWSLLALPGWRALSPDSLGRLIEARIHDERRGAVRVVERGRPRTIRGAALLLNAPLVAWHHFAALAPSDRLAWLAWTWAIAVAAHTLGRRRRRTLPLRVAS